MGRKSSEAVKKQSSDWSSGWDADDSWSNEKDADGQGQSSPADEGWGNDWDEDGSLAESFNPTPQSKASTGAPKSGRLSSAQEGVRLASDYNWDGAEGKSTTSDLLSSVSQRSTTVSLWWRYFLSLWIAKGGGNPFWIIVPSQCMMFMCDVCFFVHRSLMAGMQTVQETGEQKKTGSHWMEIRVRDFFFFQFMHLKG